jgi:hypothetical protein
VDSTASATSFSKTAVKQVAHSRSWFLGRRICARFSLHAEHNRDAIARYSEMWWFGKVVTSRVDNSRSAVSSIDVVACLFVAGLVILRQNT